MDEPINKNLEDFIRKHQKKIKDFKEAYSYYNNYFKNVPLRIKIYNVILSLTFLLIFTFVRHVLALSIFFALTTFFCCFFIDRMYALLFVVSYIIMIVKIVNERNIYIGNPILQTDIVRNYKPYDCTSGSLMLSSDNLPQELMGGFYTYSFWLYVNGGNNSNNNGVDWYSYRFKEWKSVFYRGNSMNNDGDMSSLIQFPGIWLTPVINNMVIVFQNGSTVERLEIDNIQFNMWNSYTLVLEAKSVSIYINGLLERSLNLHQNINIMNNYNLYLTSDINASHNKKSGFAGYLAELMCYNYALSPSYIYSSYIYYKKIIDSYQIKIDNKTKYVLPGLITNSDYIC